MKKTISLVIFLSALCLASWAKIGTRAPQTDTQEKSYAEITFDTLKIDLGTFSESDPERKCQFEFTNTGNKPLVINQAFASCGCTVPNYPKTPIKPGEKGAISVTYNGSGKFPGKFSKTITVRTNARNEIVRLTITGHMTEN